MYVRDHEHCNQRKLVVSRLSGLTHFASKLVAFNVEGKQLLNALKQFKEKTKCGAIDYLNCWVSAGMLSIHSRTCCAFEVHKFSDNSSLLLACRRAGRFRFSAIPERLKLPEVTYHQCSD